MNRLSIQNRTSLMQRHSLTMEAFDKLPMQEKATS